MNGTSVGPPFELPFDLKGFLEWLMSEDWPEEDDALFKEVAQRFKRGELSPETVKRFVSVVEEVNREHKEMTGRLQKILHRSNFRVVPAQTS